MKPTSKNIPNLFSLPILSAVEIPDRTQTLADIESGKIEYLDFPAQVFNTAPNKNHVLFKSEELDSFAASFANKPFIYDHNTGEIEARHGIIQTSLLKNEKFEQSIRLTTRKGMTDFLEGRIDRFSIGWFYDEVICTICNSSWLECYHYPGQTYETADGDKVCELLFTNPQGKETSAVNVPAVEGTGLLSILTAYKDKIIGDTSDAVINAPSAYPTLGQGEIKMNENEQGAEDQNTDPRQTELEANQSAIAALTGEGDRQRALDAQLRESETILVASRLHLLEQGLATSRLPEVTQERLRVQFGDGKFSVDELTAAIAAAKTEVAALTDSAAVQGPARVSGVFNGEDQLRAAMDDLLGAPRAEEAKDLKVSTLSGIREAYLLLTGDREFTGGFFPDFAQLATTANFPAIVKDSMNKVLVQAWKEFGAAGYDWWNKIATIEHFTSLNEIDWLMLGTIGSLPSVSERGEYTPLPIGDNVETSDWTKYGGYIPLTLEALMRDDTRAFKQLPREAALGGMRNISEQVAAIFTKNSAAGPVLADGGNLFNATAIATVGGHLNLLTTALGTDYTAWEALSAAMYNQPMHVANTIDGESYLGTGKKQALDPKYCLVPRALRGQAQALFSPRWASVVESIPTAGGPSFMGEVEVLTVPEWTDATDYAATLDPKLVPGVMIGEIFGVMPQIFIAGSESDPAMFMNDESRIKVRQFLAVGVSNYRSLHKENVA